jgi:hypothetical protein
VAKKDAYTNLRGWEINRRHSFALLKGMADNLLRNLQAMNKLAQERMWKLETFFRSFKMSMKSTFAGISNFSEFKLTRTKRQGNSRRSTVENNDLYDLVVNFKEELEEFEDRKKAVEKTASETIAGKILRDGLQGVEDATSKGAAQAQSLKERIEKFESTVTREFDLLIEACIRALERQKHSPKGTDFDLMTRTTFEPLATFLSIAKGQMDSLQEYFLAVLALFEASKRLEVERNRVTKVAVEKFTEAIGEIYGAGPKCFAVSKHLGEGLDPERVAEFQFDLGALLLSAEIDAVQKRCGQKEMTVAVLQQFVASFSFEDFVKLINSFTVEKFKGKFQDADGLWVPATLYLTIENTFVLYKQTTHTLCVTTIFAETLSLTVADAEDTYLLKYTERGVVWNSSRQLKMQLTKEVMEKVLEGRERATRVLSMDPQINESFSIGGTMTKNKPNSAEDI